jgi:gamma-glutamyl-gamma-aminobutyrate hydrolase PuuD
VKNPVVLIVGREITEAVGVRGPAFGVGRTYAHAITRAGGIPIILPPISDLHDQLVTRLFYMVVAISTPNIMDNLQLHPSCTESIQAMMKSNSR